MDLEMFERSITSNCSGTYAGKTLKSVMDAGAGKGGPVRPGQQPHMPPPSKVNIMIWIRNNLTTLAGATHGSVATGSKPKSAAPEGWQESL